MTKVDDNPLNPNPSPNPKGQQVPVISQASSSHPLNNTPSPKKPLNPEEFILSVASNIASQPLQYSDPDVWAVLTAISEKARKRRQGINMLLTCDEHCIGRVVEDARFQIVSNQISGNHCKIYRKKVPLAEEDVEHPSKVHIFLKDTSTNGTYLNWEKVTKHGPESKLHHGDIISFAAPPQHEFAYAFVFREVLKSTPLTDGSNLKRKSEEFVYESKRLRGIGIGASEGPLSLDDFRSLQRSNTELRKQLENHVATIESLRSENRAAIEHHEINLKKAKHQANEEKKDLKESVSNSYIDQLKELNNLLEYKQKELAEVNRISAEQKHALEDLDERLGASVQSCTEANEIINRSKEMVTNMVLDVGFLGGPSQKASISEFKALVDEEREQRREEREKAASDLKSSIQRVQAEAQEELKRISDAALRREKEQQEIINKLQESEKERGSLVEILRTKLEDTRKKSVIADNKVRQLEAQVFEEQLASANGRKRVEELENEVRRLRKELESEKAAREEAWAKVSVLELEINAARRDLEFEKRKLRGARERIMLRETQLRAFYSTTEEISVLFVKQQEQLKAMQRTLEDEENYENISFDIEHNPNSGTANGSLFQGKGLLLGYANNTVTKAESGNSTQKRSNQIETTSDEASATEKHNFDITNQEDAQETQEADFTSDNRVVKGAFGSDIDGVDTAPVLEGDPIGTERVFETESPGVDLNKCGGLDRDTMQLDDETLGQEGEEQVGTIIPPLETQNVMADTIKTSDLLASEVAGSWACSTAPSVHGDNDSVRSGDNEDNADAALRDSSNGVVAETQSAPLDWNQERQALSEMIGIVDPDLKEQFRDAGASDTEDCTDSDDENSEKKDGGSDAETQGSEQANEDSKSGDAIMDDDDEATQEDSVG
ncbi:hypothetical protein LguiA_010304 [Lonicera macranthoides]